MAKLFKPAQLAGLGWSEGNIFGGNVAVVIPSRAPGDLQDRAAVVWTR